MKNILKVALISIIATCNSDSQSDIIKKATDHRMSFEGKVMNNVFDAVKDSKLQGQIDKAIVEAATKNVKGVKLVGFVINDIVLDGPGNTPVSILISLHDDQSTAYHFVKKSLTVTKGLEAFAYDHNAPKDYHLLDDTLKYAINNNTFKTEYNISPARKEALKAALNTTPGTEFKHTEFTKSTQFSQERLDLSLAKAFLRVLKTTKLKISSDELYINLINLLGESSYNKEDIKNHAITLADYIVSKFEIHDRQDADELKDDLKTYCANKSFQEGSNEYKMILATISAISSYFSEGGKSQEFLINKCIQEMSLTFLPIEISHQIREAMQPIFQLLKSNSGISAIITEKIPLLKAAFKGKAFENDANTLINAFEVLANELNLNSDYKFDITGDGLYFYSLYLKFSAHNDRLFKLLSSKFFIEQSIVLSESTIFDLIFPKSEFITNNANKDILTLLTQRLISHREFAGITAYSSAAMQVGDILHSSSNVQKFIALLKNSPALLTPNVKDILQNDKIGTTPVTSEDFLNIYVALHIAARPDILIS